MRNQKGITLVALVITIIVLLILAGVSISLVVGQNGVLGRASDAVVTNKVAGVKEKVSSALAAAEISYQSAWAQGISSGTTTTREVIYDGKVAEGSSEAVKGAVITDLEGSYDSGNVVISGKITSPSGATIFIKSANDVFEFKVKVDAKGVSTIEKDVKYYEGGSINTSGATATATAGTGKEVKTITLN